MNWPGALREVHGIRIEGFGPLLDHESVDLDDGTTGTLWTGRIDVTGPEAGVLAWYRTGESGPVGPRAAGSSCPPPRLEGLTRSA